MMKVLKTTPQNNSERVTDKHDNKEKSLEERQKIIDGPR